MVADDELISDNSLQVTPDQLVLGQLQQGCVYRLEFVLHNKGHDGSNCSTVSRPTHELVSSSPLVRRQSKRV